MVSLFLSLSLSLSHYIYIYIHVIHIGIHFIDNSFCKKRIRSIHNLRIRISEGLTESYSYFQGVEFPGQQGISQKFRLRDS